MNPISNKKTIEKSEKKEIVSDLKYHFHDLDEDYEEEPSPIPYNYIPKLVSNKKDKVPYDEHRSINTKIPSNSDLNSHFKTGEDVLKNFTFQAPNSNFTFPKEERTEKILTKEEILFKQFPYNNIREKDKFVPIEKIKENLNNSSLNLENQKPKSDKLIYNSEGVNNTENERHNLSNSEKNVFEIVKANHNIPTDIYFKPRKGDKTPKCTITTEKKDAEEERIENSVPTNNDNKNHNYNIENSIGNTKDSNFPNVARKINYENTLNSEDNIDSYNEEHELNLQNINTNFIHNHELGIISHIQHDLLHDNDSNINHKQYPKINIQQIDPKISDNIINSNTDNNNQQDLINDSKNKVGIKNNSNSNASLSNSKLSLNKSKNKLKLDPSANKQFISLSHNNSNNNISSNNSENTSKIEKNKSHTPNVSHLSNSSNASQYNHFSQYDIQQLTYDLVKEYSHLKINNDEDFMKRMLFDIFKRQTKDERLEKIIEKNKVKMNEADRIKTFNRLIEDANRRLEAQENMEAMKNKIYEQESINTNKKISLAEWEEIYLERFVKFKEQNEKWRHDKVLEKIMEEKKKEDEIVRSVKTKKVSQHFIDQSVNRMHEDAERRKLKLEEAKRRKLGNNFDEGEKEERELTPTKFKNKTKAQKYNFMSDMSGNELSDSHSDVEVILDKKKNQVQTANTDTKTNFIKSKSKNLSKNKFNRFNQNQINNINDNNFPLINNDKLLNINNFHNFNHVSNHKQYKNNQNPPSNCEINNKRFDKSSKTPTKIKPSIKEKENVKSAMSANKSNVITSNNEAKNKFIKTNFEFDDIRTINNCKNNSNTDEIDEEKSECLPKPLQSQFGVETVKSKDFKLNKSQNNSTPLTGNFNSNANALYMPDYLASKLVDEILQNRFGG